MQTSTDHYWRNLYGAAKRGDLNLVKNIVETYKLDPDFDIDYQYEKANTALFIACTWSHQSTPYRESHYYDIVKFLIQHGADVNIPNKNGKTPLYTAASWGHFHVVQLLILHGANLNVKVPQDCSFTPLLIAAFKKRAGSRPFEGYKIHSQHHAYYLALDYIERIKKTGEYLRLFSKIEEDYKMLIGYAATNPSVQIPDEIMEIVVKYNHFAVVKELVLAGAEINIPDANGSSVLGHAQQWNDTDSAMVTFLRENGAIFGVVVDDNRNTVPLPSS